MTKITIFEPHFDGDVQLGPKTIDTGGDGESLAEVTDSAEAAESAESAERGGSGAVAAVVALVALVGIALVVKKLRSGDDTADEFDLSEDDVGNDD